MQQAEIRLILFNIAWSVFNKLPPSEFLFMRESIDSLKFPVIEAIEAKDNPFIFRCYFTPEHIMFSDKFAFKTIYIQYNENFMQIIQNLIKFLGDTNGL